VFDPNRKFEGDASINTAHNLQSMTSGGGGLGGRTTGTIVGSAGDGTVEGGTHLTTGHSDLKRTLGDEGNRAESPYGHHH